MKKLISETARSIASELKENPDHWTQFTFARDVDGHPVCSTAAPAVCWCLSGHIHKRLSGRFDDLGVIFHAFMDYLGCEIPDYNDGEGRTVGDVISVCEEIAASVDNEATPT